MPASGSLLAPECEEAMVGRVNYGKECLRQQRKVQGGAFLPGGGLQSENATHGRSKKKTTA
jgi:hypothetical protein